MRESPPANSHRRPAWRKYALLVTVLCGAQQSCSVLSSIAGSAGVPTSVTSTVSKLPQPVAVARSGGSFSSSGSVLPRLMSAAPPELRAIARRVDVPAVLLLAKSTGQLIASHIEQRMAERKRQQQANQLFYAGRCQLAGDPAATKPGANSDPEVQAEIAFAQGDYAKTDSLLAQAERQFEGAGEGGKPGLARVLLRRSALLMLIGQLDKAEAPAVRSLELREKVLGKGHPEVAESLTGLAAVYQLRSDFSRAEPPLQRALQVRESALQSGHLCVAQTQHQLAELYQEMAAYTKAEGLYQSSLATRTAKLGAESLDVAESKQSLGSLAVAMGNYAEAEPLYTTALAIRRTKLGPEDPAVAESLLDLGALQRRRGAYPQAEASLRQALAIREKKLAALDPRRAESLTELATLYEDLGDYSRAEPLLRRALTLQEQSLGADHPDVAVSLTRLAALLRASGNLAGAEEKLGRALQIRQSKLGAQHPGVAETLSDLGDLALARGDGNRAGQQYERALQIRTKALGAEHPLVAATLHRQAVLQQARGDLRAAATYYERALNLRKKVLGPRHPDVAQTLLGFAAVKVGLGEIGPALQLMAAAREANEALLQSIAGSGAGEERLDRFLRSLRAEEDLTYSLLAEANLASREDVAAHVATTALLRKGRSVDEAADTSRALYQGLGPEERQKLARLREIRSRRADLALSGSGLYSADEYQKMLAQLQAEEEQQEEALLRDASGLRTRLSRYRPATMLSDVQARLASGSALIEIVAYRQYTFSGRGVRGLQLPGSGPLRYGAVVITESGKPRAFDLGPARTIDGAVAALLAALTATDSKWQPMAAQLAERVLGPMDDALEDPKRWYIAADGQLNLVPFAVLPRPGAKGKSTPLVEKVDLSYLTSGRDLLREPEREVRTNVALLADPQFAVLSDGSAPEDQRRALAAQRSTGLFRGLRLGKVAPLPGTREEAQSLEKLLRKAEVRALYGADARKNALLAIDQPGILHIATHGLFVGEATRSGDTSRGLMLDSEDVPTTSGGQSGPVSGSATDASVTPAATPSPTASPSQQPTASASAAPSDPGSEAAAAGSPKSAYAGNPLLGSMLVLAGAETAAWLPPEQRDPALGNGLVTALEVASMNLWGTQLVVLSACDTGRGDVSNLGQGVYGLRRAVMVAGAETLLTSLWKVDDKATRDLMERYYKNLLKGRGRSDAMREAALQLRKSHPHPYYWAPFIPIGRAAPLAGIGKAAAARSAAGADDNDP